MRVKESNLRRLIRKQLREQGAEAAYSGAKKSDLTGQEKRQMKNAISAAVGQGLADEKIATADDTWSLRVRVGRDGRWRVKQLSDNLKHRKREVLRIVSRAVNQEEVQEFTDKLAGWGRRLTVTINDPESPQSPAITEEDPAPPSPKPKPRPTDPDEEDEFLYDPDECVKKQQRALGVDDDGLWGPNTQKAWDKMYPNKSPPTNSSDLPACKPEKEEVEEEEKEYKCPPGTEQGDCPDGTYEDEDYQGNKSCVDCEEVEEVQEEEIDSMCEEKSAPMWKFLRQVVGGQFPIANPDLYARLTDNKNILGLFAGDPEIAQVDQAARETQALFKKLMACDGSGCRKGHSIAANQLIAKLRSNVDIFNNTWRNVLDRAINSGKSNLVDAAAEVWEYTKFADYFGPLPGGTTLPPNLIKMRKLDNRGEAPIRKIGDRMDKLDCPGGVLQEGWVRWQSLAGIKE